MLNVEHKQYEFDGVNWVERKPILPSLDYVYNNFVNAGVVYSPYIPINDTGSKQIQTQTNAK